MPATLSVAAIALPGPRTVFCVQPPHHQWRPSLLDEPAGAHRPLHEGSVLRHPLHPWLAVPGGERRSQPPDVTLRGVGAGQGHGIVHERVGVRCVEGHHERADLLDEPAGVEALAKVFGELVSHRTARPGGAGSRHHRLGRPEV